MPCGDHQAVGAQGDRWHSSDDRVAGAQAGPSGSLGDRVAAEFDEQSGRRVRSQSSLDAPQSQFDHSQVDEGPRVSHRGVSREEWLLEQKSLWRI